MSNCRPHWRGGLPAEGIRPRTSLVLGFHTADDPVIWERARSEHAVIISKDEDFVDHWF
jgi:predicted nuclease of predicted toxin-antitoxin system